MVNIRACNKRTKNISLLGLTGISIFMLMQFYAFPTFANNDFFDQRYRGWLWFEDKEKIVEEAKLNKPKIPTAEEAKEAIEAKKKAIDDARNIMIEVAYDTKFSREEFIEVVFKYRKLEKEMQDSAMRLATKWGEVNFLHPDFIDELENPSNLYGRRVKEEVDQASEDKILRNLAGKVELFVFRQGSCPYCPTLEKHLNIFAHKYGFKVEAISPDKSESKYFKTTSNPELIKALKLELMPTVILVTKDSSKRFEISRGLVSTETFKRNALQAANFLESSFNEIDGKIVRGSR